VNDDVLLAEVKQQEQLALHHAATDDALDMWRRDHYPGPQRHSMMHSFASLHEF